MYFWTYGLEKARLDQCLKSPVLEDPSTSNMVNQPKHFSKPENSTFTKFIESGKDKWGCKSLSEQYVES